MNLKIATFCLIFPLVACAAETGAVKAGAKETGAQKTGVTKPAASKTGKTKTNTTEINMSTTGNYSPNAYNSSATIRTDSGADDCLEKLEIRLLKRKKQYDPKKHKACK